MSIRNLTENITSRPEIFFFVLFCTKNTAGDIFLNQVQDLINIQDRISKSCEVPSLQNPK